MDHPNRTSGRFHREATLGRVRRGAAWILPLFAVAASALVLMLSLQVRALRGYQRQVQHMKAYPHGGQWVPTIRAGTLQGDSITVGETQPGRAQVLIAFSTSCPYCLATLPTWKAITDSLRHDPQARFDVIWVSASSWDSTRAYVQRHQIDAVVARMPTPKLAKVYQFKMVPLTVVLDRYGRVAHAHASVFGNAAAMDSIYLAAYRAVSMDSTVVSTTLSPQIVRR